MKITKEKIREMIVEEIKEELAVNDIKENEASGGRRIMMMISMMGELMPIVKAHVRESNAVYDELRQELRQINLRLERG